MAKKKQTPGAAGTDTEIQQPKGILGKVEDLKEYFEQSKAELKKVTWPSRKETIATCSAVLVLVVVMSLFLGVVDMGLAKLVEAILS
jgi:preprotein translocase subunit SecE